MSGETLDASLDWWQQSERRRVLRSALQQQDGIDADDVIMSPDRARSRGLASTICFPVGNLAPEGAVIKSTAIDASLVDADGVFRHVGPARVFVTKADAIKAIKSSTPIKTRAVRIANALWLDRPGSDHSEKSGGNCGDL